MKLHIPIWLWIVIALEMLPLFLGPLAALTRPTMIGGPDAQEVTYAAWLYAARNLSVGLVFLLALYLRNAAMLLALICIRLLTDLVDLPTLLSSGLTDNPARVIAIFVCLYYVPAPFAIHFLWRKMQRADN